MTYYLKPSNYKVPHQSSFVLASIYLVFVEDAVEGGKAFEELMASFEWLMFWVGGMLFGKVHL